MPRGRRNAAGSARMIETGKRPMQLWFTSDELYLVKALATSHSLPAATFAKRMLVGLAKDREQFKFASDLRPLINAALRSGE